MVEQRPRSGFDPEEFARRMSEPYPCTAEGMRIDGSYPRPAWTPNGFLRRGQRFMLICKCGTSAPADLQAVADKGFGDHPMPFFIGRWKCPACGSRDLEARVE
jgi:hypothetical protein